MGQCRASRGSEGPASLAASSGFRASRGSLRRGSLGLGGLGVLGSLGGSPGGFWGRVEVCWRRDLRMEVTLLAPSSSSLEYQLPGSPGGLKNDKVVKIKVKKWGS